MKFFPLLAAFALHSVAALLQDSNSESGSLDDDLPIDEFIAKYGEEIGLTEVPEAWATPDSTSGSGSLQLESFADVKSFLLSGLKDWSASEWKAMNDWVKPNSAEFHAFEKKMNETNALVAKIKKMPESESIEKMYKLSDELADKMDEVRLLVSDSVQTSSRKVSEAGEMTMEKFLEVISIVNMNTAPSSGSDSASTEGSDESSITQTSVESVTQSSPSFQKAWDKLAGSAPAGKSTK